VARRLRGEAGEGERVTLENGIRHRRCSFLSKASGDDPGFFYAAWKEDSREIAAVFGRTDEIDKQIERFENRTQKVRTAMSERSDDLTASFIRILPDEVRIHTRCHFAGRILEEAGLRRPPQQLAEDLETGRAHEVEESYWLTGGVQAANRVLDDLFEYLLGEGGRERS